MEKSKPFPLTVLITAFVLGSARVPVAIEIDQEQLEMSKELAITEVGKEALTVVLNTIRSKSTLNLTINIVCTACVPASDNGGSIDLAVVYGTLVMKILK